MWWKSTRAWGDCNPIHGFYLVQGVYLFSKDMMKESEEDNTVQSVTMSQQNRCALNVSCKKKHVFSFWETKLRGGGDIVFQS